MNRKKIYFFFLLIGIALSGNAYGQTIDTSLCQHLVNTAERYDFYHEDQQAYDTMRAFVENCAMLPYSYNDIFELDGFNATRSDDPHRFGEYREWLKKVLYLNPDTIYYCQVVHSILTTFTWFNDSRGYDLKGALAVDSFIVKSGKCPDATLFLDTGSIPAGWKELYSRWLDTAQNPSLTPFDSTLPTLEDLDLGILRGPPSDVHILLNPHSSTILSVSVSDNPFKDETKLQIKMNDAALLHLEIYDVLGKRYFTDAKFFESGNGNWAISGKDLPQGILYFRISTLSGEVQTVKLVHE